MGCYSFTCAVSGLPIGADDPVYYLLVQQSPWVDRSAWDAWVPRTLPLRGLYDSYGGVKDIADDAARAVWAECLDATVGVAATDATPSMTSRPFAA